MKKLFIAYRTLSTTLHVNRQQIQRSLIFAPVYTLFTIFSLFFLFIIIKDVVHFGGFLELLCIFLIYILIILITYFVITLCFIYLSQLILLKFYRINFYTIMLSAFLLTGIFIGVIVVAIPSLTNMIMVIPVFAFPIAACYWLLLWRQHQKNPQLQDHA